MSVLTELFVPGRLCLFGEHSDWAGANKTVNSEIVPGCAIVTGVEQGIYATAEKNETFLFTSGLKEQLNRRYECLMDPVMLKSEAENGGYFSYVAGTAAYIYEHYPVSGIHIHVTAMDLPMKKGLSSSAAVCVLVAKAFNEIYSLNLSTIEIMNVAFCGEQYTPSRCGRLDQACAFGIHPVAMYFNGGKLQTRQLSVGKTLYFVFADLMAGKDTIKILADLNSAYPFARNEREEKLHQALGEDNQKITEEAIRLIAIGDIEKLGNLMTKAQKLFDEKVRPMCEDQLAAPVLHRVLDDLTVKELTYGGKGVGSQGDGTVQLLAKDADTQSLLIDYLHNKLGLVAYKLTIHPNKVISKAIIPIAGFGTRLFPLTRFVKKELCPVVDSDGLVKPVLLVLMEELDRIGIEKICLIVNPDERKMYEDLFFSNITEEHYHKLPVAMKEYEIRLRKLTEKLVFICQSEPLGFGHAVFQAEKFAGNEPVLLLLGDTVFESFESRACTKQLIEAFEMYGKPFVAIQKIPFENAASFGVFAGVWENETETVMKCTQIKEKPNSVYARDYLTVRTKKEKNNCYGAFGAYVLTEDIFRELKSMIQKNIKDGNAEIGLTEALDVVCHKKDLYGLVINGRSYDLGNPEAFRNAVASFGLDNYNKRL